MIILRKKRLFLISLCILVSFIAIAVEGRNNKKTIETVSLPVTNKIIVLDAGHGIPDEGAQSNNGTTENIINLKIARKVQNLLEQSGSTVILTRSDENGIYDLDKKTLKEKKVSDIHNRVKIGNESGADIFVSIHLNKIPQSQYWGWQTFFKKGDEKSEKLAKCIQENMKEAIQRDNKRESLSISGKYIVDHVNIPISIVECGFLSNPEEEKLLQEKEYQDRIAWGIYNGIISYFRE